ncbi:MAG: nucleoid-associated protein EbfC [Thermosediminibacterales bacterium]|nr:nucleoid-associated protein EbfC [Thermosediminibacterales bacterium]MDK2835513.1 nucleoid-associated protein EbfC [Thermosediminibacterales bacterium]
MFDEFENLVNNMKGELAELQNQLRKQTVEVTDKNKIIKVKVNGLQEIYGTEIDPGILKKENQFLIEKAVTEVIREVFRQSKNLLKEQLSKMTAGIDFPDFPKLF